MRLLLNMILVILTVAACYLEDIYLFLRPPQTDMTLSLTIRSRQAYRFDQQKALAAKRKEALSLYVPVYRYIPPKIEVSRNKFKNLERTVAAIQKRDPRRAESLSAQLRKDFGVALSSADVSSIARYRDVKILLEGILTIEESILQNKIVGESLRPGDNKAIEIHSPNSAGTVTHPVEDVITIARARDLMEEKVRQLFWQVDKRVLDPLLEICLTTLQPNLEYDQKENDRRLEKINRQFPSGGLSYQPGDVLVEFGSLLNDGDIVLLKAYRQRRAADIYTEVPGVVFTIVLIVAFYNLFLCGVLVSKSRSKATCRSLLILLTTTVLILKGYLLFLPFPVYGAPFAMLAMLIIFLNHGKVIAAATTLAGALLISMIIGPALDLLIYFSFGGLAAVLASSGLTKRLQIIAPASLVGLINAISVIVFSLDWQVIISRFTSLQSIDITALATIVDQDLKAEVAWAVIGGLAAAPLTLLLLPIFEVGERTSSNFKLNRYQNLNRPLINELRSKAPGTYQHSMAVAYLAQAAGQVVGANILLLKIGAYYHDIGKVMNPRYFIENQSGTEDPHDLLEPLESVRINVNHVRHGMKIGQESGLPRVVVDLILQHHGTRLMEDYYNSAAQTDPAGTVQQKDFCYPGPKPQSVEAAILMVANSLEAACRSLEEPTRAKIEKMVRLHLIKRIAEGQFAECDLSSRDLPKIAQALVEALQAYLRLPNRNSEHTDVNGPPRTGWRIGALSETPSADRAFRP